MSFLRLPKPVLVLLGLELRELLGARSLWVMLLLLCPLMGYSFIQSVNLYSEASRTALQFPELAKGMTPLDGILTPTFGALYLVMTLLFPFVAIRLIGNEKQSGSLKLLLQLPISPTRIVTIKVLAVATGWLLALIPVLSALFGWAAMGGHLYAPELLNLILGHALYALVITGIAFFAATVTDSPATAAIVALAFTIGSWVLDFAAGTTGWLGSFSSLSLTASLQIFERGLFALPQTGYLLLMATGLFALTVIWLPTGIRLLPKLQRSTALIALVMGLIWLTAHLPYTADVTENRRNSFNPAEERALRRFEQPLHITIYLAPDDSRLKDMERDILSKLRRSVPKLTITRADINKAGLLGASSDDNYGLIVYEYAGKKQQSRSNSAEEILPILYQLAGQTVKPDPVPESKGYPLVADASRTQIWFYGLLPALFMGGWWFSQRPMKRIKRLKT